MSDKAKLLIARNYVDAICRDDISRVDDVQTTDWRPTLCFISTMDATSL